MSPTLLSSPHPGPDCIHHRHGRACSGHLAYEDTALPSGITGTSPVMTAADMVLSVVVPAKAVAHSVRPREGGDPAQ